MTELETREYHNTLCEAVHLYDGDYGKFNLANGWGNLDVTTLGNDYLEAAIYHAAGAVVIAAFSRIESGMVFEQTAEEVLTGAMNKAKSFYQALVTLSGRGYARR